MWINDKNSLIRIAASEADLLASQRLRYRVFVEEFGAEGPGVDHKNKLETDQFDKWFDHLVLIDTRRDEKSLDHVIGVYRLLRGDIAKKCGFYSESEYDLKPLVSSGRSVLELGRSCVHPEYRGGTSMFQLWNGLAEYVLFYSIDVLFGVASFQGVDIDLLSQPLSYLHHHHLAPSGLRVRVHDTHYEEMNRIPESQIDQRSAMVATPALIKAYLRLGGYVGDGAFIDRDFKTVDVCVLMDTKRMSERHRQYYERNRATA